MTVEGPCLSKRYECSSGQNDIAPCASVRVRGAVRRHARGKWGERRCVRDLTSGILIPGADLAAEIPAASRLLESQERDSADRVEPAAGKERQPDRRRRDGASEGRSGKSGAKEKGYTVLGASLRTRQIYRNRGSPPSTSPNLSEFQRRNGRSSAPSSRKRSPATRKRRNS